MVDSSRGCGTRTDNEEGRIARQFLPDLAMVQQQVLAYVRCA